MTDIKVLVEEGFAVHWLHPRAKRPIGDDWSTRPVASWEMLDATYRNGNNVGVRLGRWSKVSDHYLHVVDLDIRKPEKKNEAYAELRKLFPKIDTFPCVVSGSGGESRHFYVLSDQAFDSKKLAHSKGSHTTFDVAKGRDVKHWDWEIELFGTGKQVAMPPSIHPDTGNPYQWLREFDFTLLEFGVGPIVDADDMPTAATRMVDVDDETEALLSLIGTPKLGLTHEEIRDITFALPLAEWCEDRDGWLHVGMAIHHETDGSDVGFDIWCDFSKRSTKFSMKDQRVVWRSFDSEGRNVKTMGSLRKVIREEGGDFLACKQKLELASTYRKAIADVSQYKLSPTEIDTVIPRLQELAENEGRVAKAASIKKDITEARKDTEDKAEKRRQKSLEDWLADEVLRLFYNRGEHLRRFSGQYWVFDKGVWRTLDPEIVNNKVYRVITKVMKDDGDSALQELLDESGRTDTLNALVNAVSGLVEKKSACDDREDPLNLTKKHVDSVINCSNGELWFKDGDYKFIDHDPEHMMTTKLGCAFDPMAECPEWDNTLDHIFGLYEDKEEVIRHFYELMGYVIQTQRNHAMWLMFYGSGSNGKSLVTSILQNLIGGKAWVAKSLAEFGRGGNNHIEAGLVGKLALIDDDYKKGVPLPDDSLKKLSEGKAMTANPKFGAEFNFISRCVPIMLVNHWPKTSDLSHGLTRRAQVINFNRTITEDEKDVGLEWRITNNELPGVLNHFIEGWCRLQKRGRLQEPKSCRMAKETWFSRRNATACFISEQLELTRNPDDQALAVEVWNRFQEWRLDDNSGLKVGRNTFYDEVAAMPGISRKEVHRQIVFCGLKLKEAVLPFDDESLDDLI